MCAVVDQYNHAPYTRKGTAKLNEILEIERNIQAQWESEKIFEENAPTLNSPDARFVILDIL